MYLVKQGFLSKNFNKFLINRKIYISKKNMEKAIETIEKNPYYEKYASKISKLQKTSPEEFLGRAEKAFAKYDSKSADTGFTKVADKGKSPLPSSVYTFAPKKKLDSVMKTELIKDKTPEEIKYIWTEHFIHKDAICGVLSPDVFDKIQDRAVKYPMFLFPLPRDQGYEFIYAQFAANEIHFTPLINYQAYKENAPECLTMIHYPDLVNEKHIVLMHGEFNNNIISSKEAQFLANQVMLYYGGDEREKLTLLNNFHDSPNSFKHMDLVNQIEKLDLGALNVK